MQNRHIFFKHSECYYVLGSFKIWYIEVSFSQEFSIFDWQQAMENGWLYNTNLDFNSFSHFMKTSKHVVLRRIFRNLFKIYKNNLFFNFIFKSFWYISLTNRLKKTPCFLIFLLLEFFTWKYHLFYYKKIEFPHLFHRLTNILIYKYIFIIFILSTNDWWKYQLKKIETFYIFQVKMSSKF